MCEHLVSKQTGQQATRAHEHPHLLADTAQSRAPRKGSAGNSGAPRSSAESRGCRFILCLISDPLGEGAVLGGLGSLEQRPVVDCRGGFPGVSSRTTDTCSSCGDQSPGPCSSPEEVSALCWVPGRGFAGLMGEKGMATRPEAGPFRGLDGEAALPGTWAAWPCPARGSQCWRPSHGASPGSSGQQGAASWNLSLSLPMEGLPLVCCMRSGLQ